ncbi:hypothetical protein HMPREF0063_12756 [Aeromicrobium marinum DSM 15272]|uniref:DUF485 domain-containing protein n=1 Tax=Aeromicrobium marinum DSM 15272 TaxID=585531 RepID=E2SFE7_9ACTN|nr:hypothetical protein [Aeromicrobium marinum]EFQ82048.1 hypothetical protein HMPREF0063_12756 [Aeromicrobium marinum DSM 15272]
MSGPDPAPTDPPAPGRVRITSPLTSAPAHVRRSVRQEIDETSGVGEVYVRSLVRTQLRAALTVVSTVLLTVGVLPLAFALSDDLSEARLFGVPLPWLVLGVGVYPGLILLGVLYVRFATRAERDFAALVEAQEDP